MKTARYLIVALGCLLLLLSSCFLESPGMNTGRSESIYLPPDQINDSARSFSEPFEYETLLPVSLNLQIDFYETVFAAEGSSLLEIPPQAGKAIVTLKDGNGNTVYEGGVQADGTVKAQLAVPGAQENMILTVTAEGYQERSVTIADLVNYTEINRTMGLMYEGVTAKAQVLTDSDGDLVPDVYDAFPLDSDVAFTVRIPDEESLTVAFEDLYLRERAGDADYNDFLAQYTITEYYDGGNKITKIKGEATAIAKIAGYNHRFGISIGYAADVEASIEYYDKNGNKLEDASISPHENITVPSDPQFPNKAIIPLFESTKDAVKDDIGETIYFGVIFSEAVERDKVELAPFDPFLYVYDTFYDIHLIGKDPLPGSHNPVWSYTTVAFNFMDEDGFPWALLVPADWQHPAETQFIEDLYPDFKYWRENNGASYSNWYLLPLDPTENHPPYLVSGKDTSPEYTANSDKLLFYYLTIKTSTTQEDPDGDTVYFRSSELPSYMSLNKDSGVITIDKAPPGELIVYFWSEDEWGASTKSNPLKVTFSFIEPTVRKRMMIETYPFLLGAAATATKMELYDVFGLLPSEDVSSDVPSLHNPSAMIKYLPVEDLTSGTLLFVKIYSASENFGPYSIRVFALDENAALPADLPRYEYGFSTNDSDTPYEEREVALDGDPWNDTYGTGEGPAAISFGPENPFHRYLETSDDVDWITITVP